MFSALSRSQTAASRKPESLVLDLSQSNSRTPAPATSKTPSTHSFRSVPSLTASTAKEGFEPKFNDVTNSDVRIEVVNGKGELHTLLHLHSNVLREQSDYFFNTLVKRALRDSASSAEPPPTTFTIQTSRHVPDPEIYVTVFRLFYQEEEFISEDIVCMGSVWKVLQILVVSAELQFHACTAACVDYLESVPWSDEELEDIVRLVPQLDRLQDAQPVLDRLPVRTWDEESISEALRMLLIRAVAFHDALGGGVTPKTKDDVHAGITLTSSSAISDSRSDAADAASGGQQTQQQKQQDPQQEEPHLQEQQQQQERVRKGRGAGLSLVPGTLECRDAACAILRNHQGPLLPLKTKKILLRETFVDLLQCLWSELRQHTERQASKHSLPVENPAGLETAQAQSKRVEAPPGGGSFAPSPLLESAYGRYGALTWITEVMVEFSMADEVFKWLATDKDFLRQALSLYRSAPPPDGAWPATVATAGDAEIFGSRGALLSCMWIVRSGLLQLATAILAKRLVVNSQIRSSFVRTWVPVLAEICTSSPAGKALIYGLPLTPDEKGTILTGYNELVSTLPAADQRSIFQMWYLKLNLSQPIESPATHQQSATQRAFGLSSSLDNSQRPQSSGTELDSAAAAVVEPFWFSLAPAYKRWLMRLGAPCGLPGSEL